jgi:phage-related protein
MKENFDIQFMEEVVEFLDNLDEKARKKVYYNLKKAQFINDPEVLKKLNNEIWEFRTKYKGIQYRLLAFWDKTENTVVICTHGFVKKTQKTPVQEINKAESIRKEYFNSRKIHHVR